MAIGKVDDDGPTRLQVRTSHMNLYSPGRTSIATKKTNLIKGNINTDENTKHVN